jgi:DNA polymerase III delta prime subunit
MNHAFLITGGNPKTRLEEIQKIVDYFQEKKTPSLKNHPDIFILEEESSIKINQVRALKKALRLKPYSSTNKIAIIKEAEKLTREAQNAILKTLEEPTGASVIILTSQREDQLLPTIVSRAQIIRLGSKALPQLTHADFKKSLQKSQEILKLRVGERLKLASEIGKTKEEAIKFITNQIFALRKHLLGKISLNQKSPFLKNIPPQKIIKTLRDLEKTHRLLNQQINHRLALENLLLIYPSSPNLPLRALF